MIRAWIGAIGDTERGDRVRAWCAGLVLPDGEWRWSCEEKGGEQQCGQGGVHSGG